MSELQVLESLTDREFGIFLVGMACGVGVFTVGALVGDILADARDAIVAVFRALTRRKDGGE